MREIVYYSEFIVLTLSIVAVDKISHMNYISVSVVKINLKIKVTFTCHFIDLRFLNFFKVSSPAASAVPMSQAYQDGSPVPVYGKYLEEAFDFL